MQTDNIAKRGNTPDLLSGILSVQVRNKDKITEHDRIYCQSQQVVKYAKEIGDTSLDNCLKRLEQWENNPNCPCEIELYRDFAPHSFGFRECYPDGKTGIVGGLIYHGNPDRSYSVLLEPFHGWSIHT